jgi:hypothetical protein
VDRGRTAWDTADRPPRSRGFKDEREKLPNNQQLGASRRRWIELRMTADSVPKDTSLENGDLGGDTKGKPDVGRALTVV